MPARPRARFRFHPRFDTLEDRTVPALLVTAATPTIDTWLGSPPSTIELTFNQPVNPASVGTGDLSLSPAGTVTAAAVVPGSGDQTVRYTVTGLTVPAQFSYTLLLNSVVNATNTEGNSTFTGRNTLAETPFTAQAPLGSQVYAGTSSGTVFATTGTFSLFSFAVDPGQTITVVVTPTGATTGTYRPSFTLRGPAGPGSTTVTATAPQFGAAAVLQTVPAPTGGSYTITVGGTSSTGNVSGATFAIKVLLNSAQEVEGTGAGTTNNTPATAEPVTGFTAVGTIPGADRGAASGTFTGSPDHYAVPLAAGQSVDVALGQANPNMQLFQPAATLTNSAVAPPLDVAVADLDGDGLPDILHTFQPVGAGGLLGVFRGAGAGSATGFTDTQTAVSTGGSNPTVVKVGDINGDGRQDAVVLNRNSSSVGVLLNTRPIFTGGDPPFQTPFTGLTVYPTGLNPFDLALADLNADGFLDIVTGNFNGNTVSVLLNQGNGSFGLAVAYPAGPFIPDGGLTAVAVGDVTGDSVPDVVGTVLNAAGLVVLPGVGNGTLAAPIAVPLGVTNPSDVALGDFNGDGRLDAAVVNGAGTTGAGVAVFRNQNSPTAPFGAPTLLPFGGGSTGAPLRVALADYDLDGNTDIAATGLGGGFAFVTTYLGDGTGAFVHRYDARTSETGLFGGLSGVDATGDGTPDFVVGNGTTRNLAVIRNGLSRLRVDLLDPTGAVVAAGTPSGNAASAARFVVPAAGTYFVRVSGVGRSDYSAVVVRGAGFEAEPNETPAAAQPIRGGGVIGHVGTSDRLFATVPGSTTGIILEVDPATGAVVRSFPAPAGITFGTATPTGLAFDGRSLFLQRFAGANSPLYELDPDTGAVRDVDAPPIFTNGTDGVAALGGLVYISDFANRLIVEYDPRADVVTRAFPALTNLQVVNLFGGLAGIAGPNRLVATTDSAASPGLARVVEIDPATGRVTASFETGGAGTTPIPTGAVRGVAVANNEILVSRIDGTPRVDVYTRAGVFLRTMLLAPGGIVPATALGGDGPGGSTTDWYTFTAAAGQPLTLSTTTPADGANEFLNLLNPKIELFAPDGTLVAAGTAGPDGRNESISVTAPASGAYTVRVSSEGATKGEYVLRVEGVNLPPPPVAVDDAVATPEDTVVNIPVLANDPATSLGALTIQITAPPANGTATVLATGEVKYTPAANYSGPDSFQYRVIDGFGRPSNTATVAVTVVPVADTPTLSVPDGVGGFEGTPIPLAVTSALTDTDGSEVLSLTFENVPAGVVLSAGTNNGNGTWTLTPAQLPGLTLTTPDNGAFLVTVRAVAREQANGSTAQILRSISVSTANVPPTATLQAPAGGIEGTSFTVSLAGAADVSPVDTAAGFTYAFDFGTGFGPFGTSDKASFTPLDNGPVAVRAAVRDKDGGVTIYDATVPVANVAPTATFTAPATGTVGVPLTVSFTNPSDPSPVDTAAGFTYAFDFGGGFGPFSTATSATYTPTQFGPNVVRGQIRDKDGGVTEYFVTIDVNAVPVANNDAYATDEDVALTVAAPGVLGNDTDPDGGTLAALLVSGPANGTLALTTSGGFTYTPNPDFNGSDSFTYRASDGAMSSAPATVTITVRPVNDAPTANPGAVTVDEDGVATVNLRALASDVETPAAQLTFSVSGATNGSVTLDADGFTARYTPAPNYNGPAVFNYTVTDTGDGASPPRTSGNTVSVTVRPVNDAPVASPGAATTNEDTFVDIDLWGLVVDVETPDAGLSFNVFNPANGTVTLLADGHTARYTPAANFNGPASFAYSATDTGDGASPPLSSGSTVAVTVRPVNDAPTLAPATFTLPENSPNGTVVGTVTGADVDGDALAYRIVTGNTGGAFAINPATGRVTVANPAALDFETTPVFTLTVEVSDPAGLAAAAAVTIRLTDVPEGGTQQVAIDIKPGNAENVINPGSNGVVMLAILSSPTFNALAVDLNTVTFGRTGNENSLDRQPQGGVWYQVRDVNGDGRLDVVVRFRTNLTGFQMGDTKGILKGRLPDGTAFFGEDVITTRPG